MIKLILGILVFTGTLAVPGSVPAQEISKTTTETAFDAQVIPRNSRVYIAPFVSEDGNSQGFETYLAAALRKKKVPLVMVTDRRQADFEITGTANRKGAGWTKKIFLGDYRGSASASFQVVNIKTGVVAYADSSHRSSANRGLRSSAEKLAKYLKRKIEDDEKKIKQRSKAATGIALSSMVAGSPSDE